MTEGLLRPFRVAVSAAEVGELRSRLARTRWPDQLPGAGWDYGTEREYLAELCRYWRDDYDWAGFEARANAFPQFTTEIDGQRIHFVHARSAEPAARPLLLTHGWPGCVAEFWDIIGPLTDPAAYGGRPADAFHVVAPSLPGFGFSGPTAERGWDVERIVAAFLELMTILGYGRFFAQGGDWGSRITLTLAGRAPERVPAVHVNLLIPAPPYATDGLTEGERRMLAAIADYTAGETGYLLIQATKPQSLGYGLTDSPAGLAGWIVEKFHGWSDCQGDVEKAVARDRLLDNISVYWLTGTVSSAARLYYESACPGREVPRPVVTVPMGHAAFPAETYRFPRRVCEAAYPTLCHWTEMPHGGHFAAMEQPDLLVSDIRTFFSRHSLSGGPVARS